MRALRCSYVAPAQTSSSAGTADTWSGVEVQLASGMGSGGIIGPGVLEYRDVIGSLHYAKSLSRRRT